jgi:CO/xanthine dehydrogenase FAD-binding subunit
MKPWKKFAHVNAKTLDDAAALMEKGNAAIIAGGTDLLSALRFEILPAHPAVN